MKRTTTIEHNEVEYLAELAVVDSTMLGYEDHGILAVSLGFKGLTGSWSQSIPAMFANRPDQMYFWVRGLIDFFGPYGDWSRLKGQECFVLRTSYSGSIEGLARKDSDDVLIFSEITAKINRGFDAEKDL